MKSILIIQTAFLGDVILCTALVEELHRIFPDAKIDFILKKGNEDVFKAHPFLNKVLIWDKQQNKLKNLLQLSRKIRKEKYDLVINAHRYASSGWLTWRSGAKKTIGYKQNPLSVFFNKRVAHRIDLFSEIHELERLFALISDETDQTFGFPVLHPSDSDIAAVESFQRQPYICIAPASVWFTKQYPIHQWIDFINKLPSGLQVFLIGGSADKELCQQIVQQTTCKTIKNVAGEFSLLQTAALMQKAQMNYVNDSAPLHIASAMKAPVGAVFCSTIPGFGFGPVHNNGFVIESKIPLKCRPCGIHGKKQCPESHFNCARTIETNQLLEILNS